jgi:hypothetical protein
MGYFLQFCLKIHVCKFLGGKWTLYNADLAMPTFVKNFWNFES